MAYFRLKQQFYNLLIPLRCVHSAMVGLAQDIKIMRILHMCSLILRCCCPAPLSINVLQRVIGAML